MQRSNLDVNHSLLPAISVAWTPCKTEPLCLSPILPGLLHKGTAAKWHLGETQAASDKTASHDQDISMDWGAWNKEIVQEKDCHCSNYFPFLILPTTAWSDM